MLFNSLNFRKVLITPPSEWKVPVEVDAQMFLGADGRPVLAPQPVQEVGGAPRELVAVRVGHGQDVEVDLFAVVVALRQLEGQVRRHGGGNPLPIKVKTYYAISMF